ncbi:DUF2634 domain-containing protein [Domibacillus indicus]|uniref:DUF2634 domain-containing protein n=1 Tax=Domibacillus indicus TaxID=1437523 RepID=UPI00203D41DF|nr:DUF2634 domain-containing protein [Domibacillus indicus]MCM3789417.1 DUF2634 domain-containing protein [Domibacillus indicus]
MADILEQETPVFDWEKGDFALDSRRRVILVKGGEAANQVALKALNTARGKYLIYANIDDEDLDHKYGNDAYEIKKADGLTEEARLNELERATIEALIYDPWITGVTDLVLKRRGAPGQYGEDADHLKEDEVEISFTLQTIFNQDVIIEGVILSDG